MNLSRRRFFRLAPASVGVIALGAATRPISSLADLESAKLDTTPGSITYIDAKFLRKYQNSIQAAFEKARL